MWWDVESNGFLGSDDFATLGAIEATALVVVPPSLVLVVFTPVTGRVVLVAVMVLPLLARAEMYLPASAVAETAVTAPETASAAVESLREVCSIYAWYFIFDSGYQRMNGYYRNDGHSVRAVRDSEN